MRKSIYIPILLLVFSVLPVSGQIDSTNDNFAIVDTLSDNFGLFTHDEILELTLRFDITHYTRKKPKEKYLKALLTYHINNKDSINREIKLKSRGEFRNGYCAFPPIVVNFKKAGFVKQDLVRIEKMKLVTHCMSGNEDNLLKEYLIYKMYNILTDSSFKVRLLRINYINTYKKSKPIISYGFFIEPVSDLAERIHCIPVESVNLTQKNIQPEFMDRTAIFNFMIGNTDWSVPNQHNVKIFTVPGSSTPELGMVIPYDFDYSGFVNAHYAVPAEGLKISSVRERVYLGICRDADFYANAIRQFASKKEDLYKMIREFPYLKDRTKKDMMRYLDEFYSDFDKQNRIVSDFLRIVKVFNFKISQLMDEFMSVEQDPIWNVLIRFAVTLVVLFVVIRLIYYRYSKKDGKAFSFFLMGIMIFLVCILLKTVEIQLGVALGLFAVFAILRFRSRNLPLREMTYFFTILGIAVINAMASFYNPVRGQFLINTVIILSLVVLEIFYHKKPRRFSNCQLTYDKLELLNPDKKQELLDDLTLRTGIKIEKARIRKIDVGKGTAELDVFYKDTIPN